MSGGGMSRKRCAFPSMALLLECFSLFLGRVFSPPRVWLGRDAGQGAARSRLRLKACDSMTVFHGSVCLLLLMCAPHWRPVAFMQRKGLPCLGQSLFVAQDERMPGGSLSRP